LHCAIEVLAIATFDDAAGHYKFEGNITGYYADPGSKDDACIKAGNNKLRLSSSLLKSTLDLRGPLLATTGLGLNPAFSLMENTHSLNLTLNLPAILIV